MKRKKVALILLMTITGIVVAGTLIARAGPPPADAKYVGTAKCKMCHFKEYKTYKATRHAKNFEVLQGDERSNPDCLRCHTTGYGRPGGFVSEDTTPKLTNVGCESCHGPGSAHIEAAKASGDSEDWDKKNNKIPANTCVECHNPHINQKARVAKMRAEAGG